MWSKLLDTDIAVYAKEMYDNNYLPYHNWRHILSMYGFLDKQGVLYNEDLDYAVLFHDIVYDDMRDKELRSADRLFELGIKSPKAHSLIMDTINHILHIDESGCTDALSKAIIMADLHELTNLVQLIRNFSDILDESVLLYGISYVDAAKGNHAFMSEMRSRIISNYVQDHADFIFWGQVIDGIDTTLYLAQSVVKSCRS